MLGKYPVKNIDSSKRFSVCSTCKNRVLNSALKQVPVFSEKGGVRVKGICYVCGHFAKWLPLIDTKYFTFKNKKSGEGM